MNALLNENTGKKKHYLKRAPFLKVIERFVKSLENR